VIRAPFTNADLLCFEADCIAVFFEAFLLKPPEFRCPLDLPMAIRIPQIALIICEFAFPLNEQVGFCPDLCDLAFKPVLFSTEAFRQSLLLAKPAPPSPVSDAVVPVECPVLNVSLLAIDSVIVVELGHKDDKAYFDWLSDELPDVPHGCLCVMFLPGPDSDLRLEDVREFFTQGGSISAFHGHTFARRLDREFPFCPYYAHRIAHSLYFEKMEPAWNAGAIERARRTRQRQAMPPVTRSTPDAPLRKAALPDSEEEEWGAEDEFQRRADMCFSGQPSDPYDCYSGRMDSDSD
jgi:hypothetical protein